MHGWQILGWMNKVACNSNKIGASWFMVNSQHIEKRKFDIWWELEKDLCVCVAPSGRAMLVESNRGEKLFIWGRAAYISRNGLYLSILKNRALIQNAVDKYVNPLSLSLWIILARGCQTKKTFPARTAGNGKIMRLSEFVKEKWPCAINQR